MSKKLLGARGIATRSKEDAPFSGHVFAFRHQFSEGDSKPRGGKGGKVLGRGKAAGRGRGLGQAQIFRESRFH